MEESRREMLARFLRDAGRTARPLIGGRLAEVERAFGAQPAEDSPRASPVTNRVSPQTVAELAREVSLPVPEDLLTGMARVSLALSPFPRERRLPAAPARRKRCVLALSLREPLLEGSDLPPLAGMLLLGRDEHGDWRLRLSDDTAEEGHFAYPQVRDREGIRLLASRELVLPREWSEEVGELGIDDAGLAAWGRLRALLAAEQGRELYAEADRVVSHRWLGIPDDRSGSMELECELRARGIHRSGEEPNAHPRATELASLSSRWRLLLQLSADQRLGWRWGEGDERLYLWMTREDMRGARFERARAVIR